MTDDSAELKALYPNLSEKDLAAAKENLDRYLSLAWEIAEDARFAACDDGSRRLAELPSRGQRFDPDAGFLSSGWYPKCSSRRFDFSSFFKTCSDGKYQCHNGQPPGS